MSRVRSGSPGGVCRWGKERWSGEGPNTEKEKYGEFPRVTSPKEPEQHRDFEDSALIAP